MEGENLLCTLKSLAEENNYFLFIQNDTNTYGYNQCVYLSINNAKKFIDCTFKIVNFVRRFLILEKKVLIFYERNAAFCFFLSKTCGNRQCWYRDGNKSPILNQHSKRFNARLIIPYNFS